MLFDFLCTAVGLLFEIEKRQYIRNSSNAGNTSNASNSSNASNACKSSNADSKWIEAVCTQSTTSDAVIEELSMLFAQFGIPEMIVTDNGTCFISAEFEAFLE